MTVARCPKCNIEVGSTWRWCLACGYDPDGSAQRVRQAAIEARQREGGWLPVVIVVVGLLVGGVILWRTTPDDTKLPTESPGTAAEVLAPWVSFTPAGGGFRVDLPSTPATATVAGEDRLAAGEPVESYSIGAAGHLFAVSVLDTGRPEVAADPAASDAALRAYVDELAVATSGEVTSVEAAPADGAPGLSFRISHAVVGEVRGRAVLIGGRLASVTVSSRELAEPVADRVTGSLALR